MGNYKIVLQFVLRIASLALFTKGRLKHALLIKITKSWEICSEILIYI